MRIDGVIDQGPAHAAGVQRQHSAPVTGALDGGPAQQRAPVERQAQERLRLRARKAMAQLPAEGLERKAMRNASLTCYLQDWLFPTCSSTKNISIAASAEPL